MKKSKNKVDNILLIMSIAFIFSGVCTFSYPKVSDYIAKKNQVEAIREYNEIVVQIDEEKMKEEMEKAQTYNENLSGDPVHDPFVAGSGYALPENYLEVLNISSDGIMAYIEIPKISVYFLTGHTGLPSAELFTRLDELVKGDIFYIHVLNETITYKVYETKVILPNEIKELQITKGRDLITLVTCTPYGVNTHRLLVKAERTEYEEYIPTEEPENNEDTTENLQAETKGKEDYYLIGIKIGIVLFLLLMISIFIIILRKKIEIKRKKSKH